jgi:plasmid maintenance system killer protein
MEVIYIPRFVHQFEKLSKDLQDEALEKIKQFRNVQNHPSLAVHKLHGPLRGRYSFSVNFKYRIVFQHLSKTEAVLLAIGDHEVYQ